MIKVHLISDLWLEDNEWCDPIDEELPECDLVIINGNCGASKRTMVYVEFLCKKYPEKQFIYNMGKREFPYQKSYDQIATGLTVRQKCSELWPNNLHYSYKKPFNIQVNGVTLDIFCLHGYPNVNENVAVDDTWKNTSWYRYFYHGITHDQSVFKAPQAADVYHGHWPIWSTPELCRQDHNTELNIINEWLNEPSESIKVLVTALSPLNDASLDNIEYTMYDGIQPDYWFVGGAPINTIAGRCQILGNPGRGSSARNTVFTL
jgi:hypothetical protein